jgi:hypothetical protein
VSVALFSFSLIIISVFVNNRKNWFLIISQIMNKAISQNSGVENDRILR